MAAAARHAVRLELLLPGERTLHSVIYFAGQNPKWRATFFLSFYVYLCGFYLSFMLFSNAMNS